MRTVQYEYLAAVYIQINSTLSPSHGQWLGFSWEKLNDLSTSIGFLVLVPEGLQRACRGDWKDWQDISKWINDSYQFEK